MSDWMGIVWLVVLLLGNAFFVAAEFAIMSARRSQIEPLAEAGSRRAQTTLKAMEQVSLMLACAQLGITVCSLLILQVAEPAIHHLIAEPLEHLGIPEALAGGLAFAAALAVVTFLHVTFGEMVPKNISVSAADKAALLLAPVLSALATIVRPIVGTLNWTANHVLKLMRVEPKDEVTSSFTLEEVQSIVQESTRHGLVEDDAGLLSGALEFSERTAAQVMVPLNRLATLSEGATPQQFERMVAKTGYSRFLLKDEDGELSGYLHVKDVISIPESQYGLPIAENRQRSLVNIAPELEVEDVLARMQKSGSHVARVVEPDGSTLGVLFLEDVIEELVGEIQDETQAKDAGRYWEAHRGSEAD
ncbi:hemolysin family protein [Arthrobacter sp. NPDC090010]|uniref:hemolysin family protein n=1 Tax=Arthrobacter sp. NPDC090010 TaxID=3363942 RepID=UPI003814BA13